MNFNLTDPKNHDEWLTPPELIKSLGEFDLDPCAPHPDYRPWSTAKTHFHKELDGLAQDWTGRVWCNPPYGRETFIWLAKLATHKNGIALIFSRTETKGFHSEVWNKADAVFFFKGRLAFHKVTGERALPCNAPSCLVIYGTDNIEAVRNANLKGKLVIL